MSHLNNIFTFLQKKQKEVDDLVKQDRDLAFRVEKDDEVYEAFTLERPKINSKDIEKLMFNVQEYLIGIRECEEFQQFGKSETRFKFIEEFFSLMLNEVTNHVHNDILAKIDSLYGFNPMVKKKVILLAYAAMFFMQNSSFEDKDTFRILKMKVFERLKTLFPNELEIISAPSAEFQQCVFSLLPLLSCLIIAIYVQKSCNTGHFEFIFAENGAAFDASSHTIIKVHPIFRLYDTIPQETFVQFTICPGIKFTKHGRASVLPLICPVVSKQYSFSK